jgi:hypothetical protein
MRVLYINNAGAGFADHIEVEPGTTVERFFQEKMPEERPQDYLIRVNRQPVSREQVLQPGDRVSITAIKIAGA